MSRWRCTWTKLDGCLESVVEQRPRTDGVVEFSWLVMRKDWLDQKVLESRSGLAATVEKAQQECEKASQEFWDAVLRGTAK